MKKNIKIIYTLILVIMMILMISNQAYAATRCTVCGGDGEYGGGVKCSTCGGSGMIAEDTHSTGDIISGVEAFIETGSKEANDKIDPLDLKDMSDTLYNILLVVGIVAAIIVGLVLGIKFILGSIEEKAEIKTMIIPYIIGCVVVFGAFTIWQIVVNLLQSM